MSELGRLGLVKPITFLPVEVFTLSQMLNKRDSDSLVPKPKLLLLNLGLEIAFKHESAGTSFLALFYYTAILTHAKLRQ